MLHQRSAMTPKSQTENSNASCSNGRKDIAWMNLRRMIRTICVVPDGFYYAAFFKHYRRILAHPEILDNPPEEVLSDID